MDKLIFFFNYKVKFRVPKIKYIPETTIIIALEKKRANNIENNKSYYLLNPIY